MNSTRPSHDPFTEFIFFGKISYSESSDMRFCVSLSRFRSEILLCPFHVVFIFQTFFHSVFVIAQKINTLFIWNCRKFESFLQIYNNKIRKDNRHEFGDVYVYQNCKLENRSVFYLKYIKERIELFLWRQSTCQGSKNTTNKFNVSTIW